MFKKIEIYIKEIIYKRRHGILPFIIRCLLLPLSWLYQLWINCRNWLYDSNWLRRYVPPIPLVISVGNIVAGGTGKTPFTIFLANFFYERFTMAILSRGYRSQAEKLNFPIVQCLGQGPIFPASYCGDEPYLFSQRLPKAMVIVGSNRKEASFLAAKGGAQLIILDDAMQHRHLARDFDIVIMDIGDPFGQGYFLPRGFLREGAQALMRAHLIVLNHTHEMDLFNKVKKELVAYTRAPIVGTKERVVGVCDLKGQRVQLTNNCSVGIFCAIAHPQYFKRTLEKINCTIVAEYILADHDLIDEKNLENFAQNALKQGAQWLICTEKDKVKLQDQLVLSLPIIWVQIDLEIVVGQEEWDKFLQQLEIKI